MFISSTASSAMRPRHGAAARVRALALEVVLDRHQAVSRAVAPRDAEVVADVREEDDVHVLEDARAHEVGLGPEQLLRHARPELERAGEVLALHDLLDRDRGGDVQRHAGVVPFAVTGRALDHRIVIRDARLLRGLGNAVDVGPERDHRLARSPGRHPRRRDARDPALDREAVLLRGCPVRYFEVSNSWNPSSPKLKT